MLLVTHPSWTLLVACGLLGVAVVGYPVPVDRGCVIQNDSSPHQSIELLAMLTDLFGEKLMTESNETTYYVSICRRIPLNDYTRLVGAVKFNSNGEYVVLGEIDQVEVLVNAKAIVLTYTGSDVNINKNEECLGNRWKTYITLICDPYAIEDTLKLVNEDAEQPEKCQIQFEIPTSKICGWNANVIRTPIVQHKYKNLPMVMTSPHVENTQYNNRSTNNNIVSDANDNNLNNYRHDGFVHVKNNSYGQNLHPDSEVYHKRRLLMNTDIPTLVKQPSQNVTRGNEDNTNVLTVILGKLLEIVMPDTYILIALSVWLVFDCLVIPRIKYFANEKRTPLLKYSANEECTPLLRCKKASRGRGQRKVKSRSRPTDLSGKSDDQNVSDKQKEEDKKNLFLDDSISLNQKVEEEEKNGKIQVENVPQVAQPLIVIDVPVEVDNQKDCDAKVSDEHPFNIPEHTNEERTPILRFDDTSNEEESCEALQRHPQEEKTGKIQVENDPQVTSDAQVSKEDNVEVGEQNEQENGEKQFTGVNKEEEEENQKKTKTKLYAWLVIGVIVIAMLILRIDWNYLFYGSAFLIRLQKNLCPEHNTEVSETNVHQDEIKRKTDRPVESTPKPSSNDGHTIIGQTLQTVVNELKIFF